MAAERLARAKRHLEKAKFERDRRAETDSMSPAEIVDRISR